MANGFFRELLSTASDIPQALLRLWDHSTSVLSAQRQSVYSIAMSSQREVCSGSTRSSTTTEQQHHDQSSNGDIQKSQSRDDAFTGLSSWLDHKRAMPAEWKEEMDAM